MAYGEVTGASEEELHRMRRKHLDSPLYNDHNIGFDTAYCITAIGKQQKMDTMSSKADKDDALSEIASEALDGDEEYDPNQFDE